MTLWNDVIGHEWAVEVLQAAIRHDRVGHAYLITGAAQVGKTTLAITFAQALNCTAETLSNRPCGRCRPCKLIASGRHPDVRLVTGETSGRGIVTTKIDQIRQLQQELNLTAAEARYKVAILRQFETANPSAANAFLKTLEEPPNNVVLILTAADSETLLPTISSRCRTIGLRPLSTTVVEGALTERWQVPPEKAHLLAHLADGRLGWAVETTHDPAILAKRDEQLSSLHEALRGSRVDRFILANRLSRKPEILPDLFRIWLSWWRDLTLLCNDSSHIDAISNIDQKALMIELVDIWTATDVVRYLRQTERAIWQLKHNANTRLAVENLLLGYPTWH
jgi:DNA polymerase-3 subunit delta'